MDQWIPLIGNVGFPVVVAMYLLMRIESKLDRLTTAIDVLSQTVTTLQSLK